MDDNPNLLAPHSSDAEEGVIGSCIIAERLLDDVAFLSQDDFYILRNAYVWAAIQALHRDQAAIDNMTVAEKLRDQNKLDAIGGPAYLTYLINNTPTYIHAETYARIVERTAYRRRLIDMANKTVQAAMQENASKDDIARAVEAEYYAVQTPSTSNSIVTLSSLAKDHFEELEYRYEHRNERSGVPTGFTALDEILDGGPQAGDLVIVAARPGLGKTALILAIAKMCADAGIAFGGVSLEMTNKQLTNRLICTEAGISSKKMRSGNLDEAEWDRYPKANAYIQSLPIFLSEKVYSARQAADKFRQMRRLYGIQAGFVDYLQLMVADNANNETLEIGKITRQFKLLAGEIGVPIFMLCQLNRELEKRENKRPKLSDLRGSGDIEQDADIVVFIYRDDMYNDNSETPNQAELIVAKHRNGALGTARVGFYADLMKFYNITIEKRDINLGLS